MRENTLIQGGHSSVYIDRLDRKRRNKKIKDTSKILIFIIICGDILFLTGFIAFRLYNIWIKANQSIYPVAVEDKLKISPTEIPWIKTQEECLRTDRMWKDGKCLDSDWSHLF